MSKKILVLALAVASLLAIPSAASAQEIHFKGVTTFTGFSLGGSFQANNEPKVSCTNSHVTGSFDSGSTTTGKVGVALTGCTAEFLGIKGSCNTSFDTSGVIKYNAPFHLITTSTSKPGILLTPATTTVICVGFSRVEFSGNGIIASPACGASSKAMRASFTQTGGVQGDLGYTGVSYDISAQTENSSGVTTGFSATAGLEVSLELQFFSAGTLECT